MGFKKNPEPTTELYIPSVLARAKCETHKAPVGLPCFHVPKSLNSGYFAGVCNRRALEAGFVGFVTPGALNKITGVPRFSKQK